MSDSIFNDIADIYNTYRIEYNIDALTRAFKYINFDNNIKKIVDMGSGTGILTRQIELIVDKNVKIYGVEPCDEMRKIAINLNKNDNTIYLNNTAEKTTFDSNEIDVIVIGTALHWFQTKKMIKEFSRIMKKPGYIILCNNKGKNINTLIKDDEQQLYKEMVIVNKTKLIRYENDISLFNDEWHTIQSSRDIKLNEDKYIGLTLSQSRASDLFKLVNNKEKIKYIKGLKSIFKQYMKKNTLSMKNITRIDIAQFN